VEDNEQGRLVPQRQHWLVGDLLYHGHVMLEAFIVMAIS